MKKIYETPEADLSAAGNTADAVLSSNGFIDKTQPQPDSWNNNGFLQ